jgi:hypothetical protein
VIENIPLAGAGLAIAAADKKSTKLRTKNENFTRKL